MTFEFPQDNMDVDGLPLLGDPRTIWDIVNGQSSVPPRQRETLIQRFVTALNQHPKLGESIDPFHMFLLASVNPSILLPILGKERVEDILDTAILHNMIKNGVEPGYMRSIYYLEYKISHMKWPSGFNFIPEPMRRWYNHLYKMITVPKSGNPVLLQMGRFPVMTEVKSIRPHPMELMAARLLIYVLNHAQLDLKKVTVQWTTAVTVRTKQSILLQCLRHEHGLVFFVERLHMSLGKIEDYQSIVLSWLAKETGFFTNQCGDTRNHIDHWIDVLHVPLDWIATALLVQGRIDQLNDEQLNRVLVRFLTQNTSLALTPRPGWIDHPRVRAIFKRLTEDITTESEWVNILMQNLENKQASFTMDLLDLMTDVPELRPFEEAFLIRSFEKTKIS